MPAIRKPWAIVGCEQNERVLFEPIPLQRLQHLPDEPVHFHDDISIQTAFGLPAELLAHKERHVRLIRRYVEKERPVLMSVDKLHGMLREARGKLFLLVRRDLRIDHAVTLD